VVPKSCRFGDTIGYLPSRAVAVTLLASSGPVRVIGLYVPSRDASVEKTERKRKWLAACDVALTSIAAEMPAVVAGDLNILEPGHQPRYPFFAYLHQPRQDQVLGMQFPASV